jgi:hypothetical protein
LGGKPANKTHQPTLDSRAAELSVPRDCVAIPQ